jgi:predicted amidohydrolase
MSDIQDNSAEAIRQIRNLAEVATAQGVQLMVFPECYLQGYTSNDENKARARAISLSSPEFSAILDQLASCKPTLVFGLIEIQGDVLCNAAVVVNQGKLIGSYRKTHPNEKFFQAGTMYPVFPVGDMKFYLLRRQF